VPTPEAQAERRRLAAGMVFRYLRVVTVIVLGVLGLFAYTVYHDQRNTWKSQFAGCQRGMFDRVDNIDSDLGQARFYDTAAKVRRAAGDTRVADAYEGQAVEARARVVRRSRRLLGARWVVIDSRVVDGFPTRAAVREVVRVCRRAFPAPSLLPD
jgi:hypothetical protein